MDRNRSRLSNELSEDQEDLDQDEADPDEPLLAGGDSVGGDQDDGGGATVREHSADGIQGLLASPYVLFCAIFSALGGLIFGIDQGIVSIILVMPQFIERFPEVSESAAGAGLFKGLLTAMIELGALIGALSQGCIADRFSRKYSIVLAVMVFIVGSVLQTAAMDYTMLATARFIGGIGIGMLSMVAPLYISEISPPEIRGSLLVLEELSIVTGIIIAFWITYATQYIQSEWSWRLPFLLQTVPGLILGVGILFLPFSPRWLIAQGRHQDALHALSELRQSTNNDPRVLQEWFEIRAEAQFQQEMSEKRHPNLQGHGFLTVTRLEIAGFTDCFGDNCWRRTHLGIGLMFFQQFVGINALIYYSPTLFKYMGFDSNMQLIMSGVLNCTQLVGVIASLYTIDRLGRRPLLLLGSVLMFLSHLVIAVLVGKFSYDWTKHTLQAWMSVAFLLFYMLAFGLSWGPIPWAIPSEIFPSSLRSKGVALSTSSNWLNNFIIGLITPPLIQNTNEGAYIFFATFCLLSCVWTYLFVPETSGKTLEQMDSVFGDKIGEVDQARRLVIEKEILAANVARLGRLQFG